MWEKDQRALRLLSDHGGPFQTEAYRAACAATLRGARDVSYAARAADDTVAAVALIRRHAVAEGVPYGYGGIVASRPLAADEQRSFLEAARRSARAAGLVVRDLERTVDAEEVATTSIVDVSNEPAANFAKKAQQSIRRASRAGATVSRSRDPEP